jgi:signal transduction histidine kinase/ligand-binding sensor domain-containing protein/CheY-like chemotaxis protein
MRVSQPHNRSRSAAGRIRPFRHAPGNPPGDCGQEVVGAVCRAKLRRALLLVAATPILLYGASNTDNARSKSSFRTLQTGYAVELPVVEKQDIRFVQVTDDGAPFETWVTGIAQDNRGFLWFGSNSGLYRYDGYALTPYQHDSANPNSPTEDTFRAILKDKSGFIWLATTFGGLDRLDPAQDRFTHYRHDPKDERTLANNKLDCVYQDRNGALWVGTNSGLDRLDPVTETFVHYKPDPREGGNPDRNVVTAVAEDRAGNLWVGAAAGLYEFDREAGRFADILPITKGGTNGIDPNYVSWIRLDHAGVLWIATRGGLKSWDAQGRRLTEYTFRPSDPDGNHIVVTKIYEDQDGALWLTTLFSGLLKFDRDRKTVTRYARAPGNRYSIPHSLVSAFFEDSEEGLWVGTASGVSRFSRGPPAFVNYQRESLNPRSLRDNSVAAVIEDRKGALWVSGTGGLNRLDRQTGQFTNYWHDSETPRGPSSNSIVTIREDRKGMLWLGSYGGGLNRFDPGTGRFSVYRHDSAHKDSLSSDYILSLFEDRRGTLWAGTQGGGLDRLDSVTGRFTIWRHDPQNPHSISQDFVTAMMEDRDGYLWLGTNDGLNRFDPKTDQFVAYRNSGDPRSLSHNKVNSLWEDGQGRLWIGTPGGLNLLDKNSGTFTRFTKRDGLPADDIEAILGDKQGYLWLATNNGLSRFHPRTGVLRNYSELDGLPTNNLGVASFRTPDGELIFGSSHGLIAFYPERLSPNSHPPPVALTAFDLFNRPVQPGAHSVLHGPIWATDSLTLNHSQSIFTIEFAALSYSVPEKNRYRYRLEPLESEWNQVDFRRRDATYSSLPPGKYTFRVEASNSDGVWNLTGSSLVIHILPPWWAALWLKSLAGLTIVGLTLYIYRSRVRNFRLAAMRLELQVSERTRELEEKSHDLQIAKEAAEEANRTKSIFLANMSHELRTPLNAILGFSAMVTADPSLPERHRKDLEMVTSSGDHLLDLIDEVLDMAKIEAGRIAVEEVAFDLHALVNGAVSMMRERAHTKNLQMLLEMSPSAPRFVRSDPGKVRQVLTNLISNAIKYTEKGQIVVRLGATRDGSHELVIVIEVEDTGIGIAPEDQERIFDPFVQVNAVRTAKGTGLGLSISHRFVALLGGTIKVRSVLGSGSRFRVEAPMQLGEASDVKPEIAGTEPRIALAPGQSEYRILIVEDQRENWFLLRRVLETAGFQVRVAEDGGEAIELFKTWHPNFIWMDLRLSVMNGIEAAKRIRGLEGGLATKIVAVTASAFRSQREEVLAAGMDDFLRKPYRFGEIFDCMARHLGVRYVRGALPDAVNQDLPAIIRPEDLAALPKETLEALESAVILLDPAKIDLVVSRISQEDPAVGAALARFAARLEYTPIYNLIQSCKSATMRADA